MVTIAFIDMLQSYLTTSGLSPVPKSIGVAEPVNNNDIPSVVLSLSELIVPSAGLGEHSEAVHGSLQASSLIDLANPLLPTDTSFSLIGLDRLSLTLYHGGLVDKDGSDTPLGATDIQVALDGNAFTVVPAPPGAGEVSVSPSVGQLQFGTPLPASGTLTANYFVGQWERRVKQLGGLLDVFIYGGNNTNTVNLSNKVISSLVLAPHNVTGLRSLLPVELGPVTAIGPDAGPVTARQRRLRWHFDYENIIDSAESSGGIIERIKLRSRADSSLIEEDEIS